MPHALKRFVLLLVPYRGRLSLALIGLCITAATEPALVWLTKKVVDQNAGGTLLLSPWAIPAMLVALFAVRGYSTYFSGCLMASISSGVVGAVQRKIFAQLSLAAAGFYESTPVGQVVNLIVFESKQCADMIERVTMKFFRCVLSVLALFVSLFYLNWRLSLVTLLLIPAFVLVVRVIGRRMGRLTSQYIEANTALIEMVDQTSAANDVLKLYGSRDAEALRFAQRANGLRRCSMKIYNMMAITTPATQALTVFAISIVVMMALHQAAAGEGSVGLYVAFITNLLLILGPLKNLSELNGPILRGYGAIQALFSIIDTPAERDTGAALAAPATGKLEFQHLSFTYPGQQQPALADIHFTIEPGQMVAIVGLSGAGKSTLVNLLPEFHVPTSGRICLDGTPTTDIALASLRAQIAMVGQRVFLLDESIRACITNGDATPDPARLAAAVEAAQLAGAIRALPDGLNTLIGENGNRLSGGVRQRLAIARALYLDAPILILDEATSALDAETEHFVRSALAKIFKGKTTIVIAHRLATIKLADLIVVMSQGRIVESGTHAALLEKKGDYADLYRLSTPDDLPFEGEAKRLAGHH